MKNTLNNIFDFKNNLVSPSIIVGISIILFALVVYLSVGNFVNKENNITVAGTAEKIVTSDAGKLTIYLSERVYGEGVSASASKISNTSAQKVVTYLKNAGFQDADVEVGNVSLAPICELSSQGYENCSIGIKGQTGSIIVTVNSKNIDLVKNVGAKIVSEVFGVNITNVSVEYLYNGLKDIRVQMLTEATKNAKERAEAVAKAGGSSVGSITSLSSGVFQVTAPNSVQVDDYGAYDTSTIEKKVTAVVKANFSIR